MGLFGGKGVLGGGWLTPERGLAMQAAGTALSQLDAGRAVNLAPQYEQMQQAQQREKMQAAIGPALERMPAGMRDVLANMPPALASKYIMDVMMAPAPNPVSGVNINGKLVNPQTGELMGDFSTQKGVDRAIMVNPNDTAALEKLGISPESVAGMGPFEAKVTENPDGTVTVTDISIPGGRPNNGGAVPLGTEGQILVDEGNGRYRVDIAPGSKLDTAKADATTAKTEQIAKADESIALIDSVLNDEGLPTVLGRVQGRLDPAGMSGLVMTQQQLDLVPKLEQIQGKAFMDAFQSLKGGGQITEREGQAALNAAARLQRYQSPEAYKAALTELRQTLARAKLRANGFEVPEFGDPSKYGDTVAASGNDLTDDDLKYLEQ